MKVFISVDMEGTQRPRAPRGDLPRPAGVRPLPPPHGRRRERRRAGRDRGRRGRDRRQRLARLHVQHQPGRPRARRSAQARPAAPPLVPDEGLRERLRRGPARRLPRQGGQRRRDPVAHVDHELPRRPRQRAVGARAVAEHVARRGVRRPRRDAVGRRPGDRRGEPGDGRHPLRPAEEVHGLLQRRRTCRWTRAGGSCARRRATRSADARRFTPVRAELP